MKHRDIFAFMLGVLGGTAVAYTYFSSKYATDKGAEKEESKDSLPETETAEKEPLRASESNPEKAENEQKTEEKGISMGLVEESELPEGFDKTKTSLGNLDAYLKQTTDYTSYAQNEGRPDVPVPPVANAENVVPEPVHNRPPQFISYEEYDAGMNTYEHETLLYFVDSRTLTNEQEELISDPEYLIGSTIYGLNEYDGSPIFIRNYVLGIDYEITKIPGSYAM